METDQEPQHQKHKPHEPVLLPNTRTMPSDKQQEGILNTPDANTCHHPDGRKILKQLHILQIAPNIDPPFPLSMTIAAICQIKNSSATGCDCISCIHLKAERCNRIEITNIFVYHSRDTCSIPGHDQHIIQASNMFSVSMLS